MLLAYGDETILDNVSVDIPKNSVIGIAGRSGSGKSTLLKLFMRFWNVDNGSINISGKNINDVNTATKQVMPTDSGIEKSGDTPEDKNEDIPTQSGEESFL